MPCCAPLWNMERCVQLDSAAVDSELNTQCELSVFHGKCLEVTQDTIIKAKF